MPTLITARGLSKAYHTRPLFRGLALAIEDDDRVGLIGPNGAGKSTLLKVIAGIEPPDDGDLSVRRGLRIGYLAQEDEFAPGATIESVLGDALADRALEPHERRARAERMIARCGFDDTSQLAETLSGGWRKRLAIARALLREPDLLLLDEPTNHLDIPGILWLEKVLASMTAPFIVVSHDRYLLDNVARRIVELSPAYPGGCYSVDGPYSTFLLRREELLAGQRSAEHILSQKVKREIQWMKEGRKAQRVKQQSRKDDAAELIAQLETMRSQNRAQTAVAGVDFDATGRRTQKLLAVQGLGKRHPSPGESGGAAWLFRDLTFTLSPGTRLGLLGENGSGKTTLIRVLTGELPPDEGTIQRAENLKTVVFDQKREQLPRDADLLTALCPDSHEVEFRGRRIHVGGWAQRFLFQTDQLKSKVRDLSGGEQARILLARMMLKPADVLILDEPTNDLDIPTLDILEENLESFPGAVVLVSHDRHLLDRVCNGVIGLEGDGRVTHFGDSSQWLASREITRTEKQPDAEKKLSSESRASSAPPRKLSNKERIELERIEAALPAAEAGQRECQTAVNDPAIAADHVELQKRYERLAAATHRVDELSTRWLELIEKRDS